MAFSLKNIFGNSKDKDGKKTSIWDKVGSSIGSAFKTSPESKKATRNFFSTKTLLEAIELGRKAFQGSVRAKFKQEVNSTPEARSAGRQIFFDQANIFLRSPGFLISAGVVFIAVLFVVGKK